MQYSNTQKPYTPFTDTSCYGYAAVLAQAVKNCDDFRPIAYTLVSFSNMQQTWSTTEIHAFAVYNSL